MKKAFIIYLVLSFCFNVYASVPLIEIKKDYALWKIEHENLIELEYGEDAYDEAYATSFIDGKEVFLNGVCKWFNVSEEEQMLCLIGRNIFHNKEDFADYVECMVETIEEKYKLIYRNGRWYEL